MLRTRRHDTSEESVQFVRVDARQKAGHHVTAISLSVASYGGGMFSIASRNKGQLNVFIAVLYSMMIGVAYYGRLYNCGREHLRAGDSGALPL